MNIVVIALPFPATTPILAAVLATHWAVVAVDAWIVMVPLLIVGLGGMGGAVAAEGLDRVMVEPIAGLGVVGNGASAAVSSVLNRLFLRQCH